MKIHTFLLADRVVVHKDDKISIIGAFNQITAKEFPGGLPLVFIIAEIEDAPNINIPITIDFVDSKGKSVLEKFDEISETGNTGYSNLIAQVNNFVFDYPDSYRMRLKVKGKIIGEREFVVSKETN